MHEEGTYGPIEELIQRYLSGNADNAEVAGLERWVQADLHNRAQFIASRKAWIAGGLTDSNSRIDVDAAWKQLAQRTAQAGSARSVRMHTRKLWRMAAAVLFLVVAGTVLFMQLRPDDNQYFASHTPKEVLLSDGSNITLNQNSALTWEADKDGRRAVTLKGDAYFDVARDATKPFVITTDGIEIEVLGTSFYVDARTEQPTLDVTVGNGRVAVRHDGAEVILNANEKAVFNKNTRALDKEQNTDPNFNSVKTKTLRFQNSTLDEVINTLNRQYHVNILGEPTALRTCELTATFEDKSLEAILQIIASTLNIEIIHQKQGILLRGTCTTN